MMNGRYCLLASLALASLTPPAGAIAQSERASYRLVDILPGDEPTSGPGTFMFIDDADIERDGDMRVFASVQAFAAPPNQPELSAMVYLRVGMRVNCATRMLEMLRFSGHSEDGRTIRDGPSNDTRPVQVPSAGPAAAMTNYVCDGRLRPEAQNLPALTLREVLDRSRRFREGRSSAPR
jgi:hypothetical protein